MGLRGQGSGSGVRRGEVGELCHAGRLARRLGELYDGDFAHLNLDDESGWVEAGTAELKPSNYTLTGERIEKRGENAQSFGHTRGSSYFPKS